jgi:hypothetical protein
MRQVMVAAVLTFSVACGATLNHNELLRKRASFDLECPDNDLAIEETGRNSAIVSGCGNRAAYAWDGGKKAWIASAPPAQ